MAGFSLSASGETTLSTLELSAKESAAAGGVLSVEDQVLELFTEMRLPIFRHLVWLHLRADQAEDIVQETFLRLFQHLSRANCNRHNLRGWVWRVAHNLGVNLCIATTRKKNGTELDLSEVSEWLIDPYPNPERALQQHQAEQRVAAGIQELNERDLQCLHLRAQGLGYRQIASVLGIGRSTVADTLDRVTNFLRSHSYS
jgi:RNA polymerase sigma-70 factor (ECF subfamily)